MHFYQSAARWLVSCKADAGMEGLVLQRMSNITRFLLMLLMTKMSTATEISFSSKNAYQSENPFGPHYRRLFLDRTLLLHQRFLIFSCTFMAKIPQPHFSKPVFQSQHTKQRSQRWSVCALCVEMWVKDWAIKKKKKKKKPIWHQKQVNSVRATDSWSINKASTKNSQSAGQKKKKKKTGQTSGELSWVWHHVNTEIWL